MNHTTKWNRMTVNKPLRDAIRFVRETMYLEGVKPCNNIAKGISHTIYPDGCVKSCSRIS